MKKKRIGVSSKFFFAVAVIYSVLIIILSFSLHYILKTNSLVLREVLLKNNAQLIMMNSRIITERLSNENIDGIRELSQKLYQYCKDDNFLKVIIFSKTADENYFKVLEKINIDSSFKIKIKEGQVVHEEKDINYLHKGMITSVVDPMIYSSNGAYWQSVYYPFILKKKNLVIEYIVSSSKISTALNDYSFILRKTKRHVAIVTCVVIVVMLIITFLFLQRFSMVIKNLSGHMKNAAEGNLDVSINPDVDIEFSELALSFNTIVSELKGLKEKDKIINELESQDTLRDIFKFGVDLLKEANYDQSIKIFQALTILKPEGFGSYFNLGVAFAKKRDYENSYSMFERALDSNPNHKLTMDYLEKVKRLQRIDEKSIKEYSE